MIKIFQFFLLALCILPISLSAQSTYDLSKDKDFEEVSNLIRERYGLSLALDHDITKRMPPVSIDWSETKNVSNALDQLFSSSSYEVLIVDDQAMVRRRNPQSKKSISGIIQSEEGKPLTYANIFINGTNIGTFTDEKGTFEVTIDPSWSEPFYLSASYIGYEHHKVLVDPAQTSDIVVSMTTKDVYIDDVVVRQNNTSVRTFFGDQGHHYTGELTMAALSDNAGQNVFRGLQLFPGLQANNDMSSRLCIRGGEADESLVLLDGIPLYKVDHFYGIFSNIDINALESVSLYTNGVPAEYGGRTSGIVQFWSKDLANRSPHLEVTLGSLTSSVHSIIPLSEKLRLMITARSTTANFGGNSVFGELDQKSRSSAIEIEDEDENEIETIQPELQFYDIHSKLQWDINNNHRLQLSTFFNQDDYKVQNENVFEFFVRETRRSISQITDYKEDIDWSNQAYGLNYEWGIAQNMALKVDAAYTRFDNQSNYASALYFEDEDDEVIREGNRRDDIFENSIESIHLKTGFVRQLDLKSMISLGIEFDRFRTVTDFETGEVQNFSQNGISSLTSFYAQYERNWDRFFVAAGLRSNHYEKDNGLDLAPRLSMGYKATENLNFNFSYGRSYQYVQENNMETLFGRNLDVWVLSDEVFDIAYADQVNLGVKWIHPWFTLYADVYAKTTSNIFRNVIVDYEHPHKVNNMKNKDPRYRLFFGDRIVHGLDILLKREGKSYSTWLSYTLSENMVEFADLNEGNRFPSDLDSRHQLKWVGNYRPLPSISLQASYVYASGRIYTDVGDDLQSEISKDRPFTSDRSTQNRLPDYHRIDLCASYSFEIAGLPIKATVNAFNVLDYQNILYKEYLYKYRTRNREEDVVYGTEIEQLGFTPELSINIQF